MLTFWVYIREGSRLKAPGTRGEARRKQETSAVQLLGGLDDWCEAADESELFVDSVQASEDQKRVSAGPSRHKPNLLLALHRYPCLRSCPLSFSRGWGLQAWDRSRAAESMFGIGHHTNKDWDRREEGATGGMHAGHPLRTQQIAVHLQISYYIEYFDCKYV